MTRKEYRRAIALHNRCSRIATNLLISQIKGDPHVSKTQIENVFNTTEDIWSRMKIECAERGITPIVQMETIEVINQDGYNHMVFCPLVIGFRKA